MSDSALRRFKYTKHALFRMSKRGVSRDSVENVVLLSEEIYVDEVRDVLIAVRRDKPLIVAYREVDDEFLIITVYAPSNVDKVVKRKVRLGRWRPWSR